MRITQYRVKHRIYRFIDYEGNIDILDMAQYTISRGDKSLQNVAATNRCKTLLQQIALCVQSSDKSYALIEAIGCSDKSPGLNASTFGGRLFKIFSLRQNFVAATCRLNLKPEICRCNMSH